MDDVVVDFRKVTLKGGVIDDRVGDMVGDVVLSDVVAGDVVAGGRLVRGTLYGRRRRRIFGGRQMILYGRRTLVSDSLW